MGGSWGARPPYCAGELPCAAPRLGPRAAAARWCGLTCRPRPPREQAAGGAGARGVQVQPHPPPPRVAVPSGGGEAPPGLQGGQRVAPVALKRGGGGSGGGAGGAASPSPRPVGRQPAIRCLRRAPPGCTLAVGVAGRPRASSAVRSAANGSVRRGRGGREGEPPRPGSRPRLPRAGLRRGRSICAVLGAAGQPSASSGQGMRALASAVVPPHPGCSGLFGGGAGPPFLLSASVRSWT